MIKQLLRYKKVTGIEIHLGEEDAVRIFMIEINRENSKLTISKNAGEITGIEQLKEKIDRKAPVIVSLTGKGIIHKKVQRKEDETDEMKVAERALPGAMLKEFAYQVCEADQEHVFVSFIREERLSSMLKQLKLSGITTIAGMYLGPFAVNSIQESICLPVLQLPFYELRFNENKIQGIKSSDGQNCNELIVEDEKLPASSAIAMASACSGFGSVPELKGSDVLTELIDEYAARRTFEFRRFIMIAAVFFVVILNFFAFTSYADKSSRLSAVYQENESALHQLDTLNKELAFKKSFLSENGLLQSSGTSYYADMLARELPTTISWISLKLHPRKQIKRGEEEDYYFENNLIEIKGKSPQGNELNEWIRQIRRYAWIKDVKVISYNQLRKNEEGIFSIQLFVKNV